METSSQNEKTKMSKTEVKASAYQRFVVRFYWLVIIIFFLIALSVEYFIIIRPRLEQTKDGGSLDLKSRENILAEQKEYLAKLETLKKESEGINFADMEKIKFVLAEKISVPDILKQIAILGEQSGFTLNNFSYKFEKGVLTFNFDFQGGSYQTLKAFLAEIEKNIRIMDVVSLSLKNVGNSFSLVIQSYYLEE